MITTLTGANSFLLMAKLKEITNSFIKKFGDFGLEKINAGDVEIQRLIESVQSMPFLADKRLVIIYEPSSNKLLSDKILDLLSMVNDQTDVIFVEPKFDKRSILYKTLKKKTDLIEFNELDERGLSSWLVQTVKERGGQISSGDALYLINRVGLNQLKLGNEIDKLLSYHMAVSRQSIDLLTESTPQSTIFELLDAAFIGNHKKAIKLYSEQRSQKVEPHAILALLAWQLHILVLVKAGANRSADEIAKVSRLNPFVVRKSQNLARTISGTDLKRIKPMH